MTAQARQLAGLLLQRVRETGTVDLNEVASNPLGALGKDPSIQVTWVDPARLPPNCGIAATYDGTTTPATISIARGGSAGRAAFSLLHEYGHHLRDQVDDVVLELLKARRRSVGLEERMCDSFAAAVLIPADVATRAFHDGVTAASVIRLAQESSASRQAVAMAAAEAMGSPGYVVLMDHEGVVQFAARSGNVYPIRRGAQQDGQILRAVDGVALQTVQSLDHGNGTSTGELNIDAAPDHMTTVVVAIDGAAPWRTLTIGRDLYAAPSQVWCAECSTETTTYDAPCENCGEHRCSNCGRCRCITNPVKGERTCEQCFLVRPPASFDGSTAVCVDCN